MPSSLLALAPAIVALAWDRSEELGRPIRVLDVGVGHGKYGLLVREYLGDRLELIDGVEAESRYVNRFPWLEEVYRLIYEAAIEDLVDERAPWATPTDPTILGTYDLVLMLDVLEHLDYEPAREVLKAIPAPVVISTPRDYFQNPEHVEYPTENHRSHWSAESIATVRPIDREDLDALERYGAVLVRCAPLGETPE